MHTPPNVPRRLQGRLDLFFLCLAGLMLLNLALFLWVAANYEYKVSGGAVCRHRLTCWPVPAAAQRCSVRPLLAAAGWDCRR